MDYSALAKQYGGTSAPAGDAPDYAALAKQYGGTSATPAQAAPQVEQPTAMQQVVAGVRASPVTKFVMGGVQGAADIGATLQHYLNPAEWGNGQADAERRKAVADFFKENSDPNSAAFAGGRLATNVTGTAGAGPVLGNAARIAGVAAPVVRSLTSAGFTTGRAALPEAATALQRLTAGASDLGLRAIGGGVTGGVSAGLIDPNSAGEGAAIGAALPGVMKLAGKAGSGVAQLFESKQSGAARRIAENLLPEGASPTALAELTARLRAPGGELVQGSRPTVSQLLMNPGASALEDIVHDATVNNALRTARQSQGTARTTALEGVAPVQPTGAQQARQDFGEAVTSRVIPEERAVGQRVSALYAGVDPAKRETINLPVQNMQAAVDKYMGRGTFSANGDAQTALGTAKSLSAPVEGAPASMIVDEAGVPLRAAEPATPRAATWEEVGHLRASINKALRDATTAGDKQAVGALTAQKQAIDTAINRDLSPESRAVWLEANASHAAKMDRFHTGPQAAIFQTRNGSPLVRGDEVAGKFWHGGAGTADDVNDFRRLVDENPAMLGQFRSMIATEGADTAGAAGLNTKFVNWVNQRLPGLRNAFDPAELATLQNIAADIERSNAAAAASGVRGSKSMQNAKGALDLGLIDNPLTKMVTNRVPLVGAGLNALSQPLRNNMLRHWLI